MGCEERRLTRSRRALIVAATAIALPAVQGDAGNAGGVEAACEALSRLDIPSAAVTFARAVAAGRYTGPDGETSEVPAFCRVHGEARPTADSRIAFELWMPARAWSGRYYQLGNGGYAGNFHYPSLAADIRRGNAVALTDTGHRGTGFDASWARGHPEKIVDYGYRSLKATSDAARSIIEAYYGEPSRRRYFAGCSNGGRQALMLAQRFPDDWDGILAGAPANHWTRQLASFAWMQRALRSDPESWISPAKLPAIEQAALESCTSAARVVNGIPGDPRFCRLDPATLLCESEETDRCLTPRQAATLAKIQEGPRDPGTGERIYFGFEATSAAVTGNWEHWIVNPNPGAESQLTLGEEFFKYMVHDDPQWTIDDFDASRDFAAAQHREVAGETLAHALDATATDLSRFAQRGAKLLMYFGWADAVLPPRAGVDYHDRVVERMGGADKTRAFYRLFMVPGMTHCQGGPGANAFGQAVVAPGLRDDAAHDIRRALETWVERDKAPRSLVAAKYIDDDPDKGVAASALLCPFPLVAESRAENDVCR